MTLGAADPSSALQEAILEIAREAQVLAGRADAEHGWPERIGLVAAGNDIAALAGALAVIARRSKALEADDRYPRGL